MTDIVIQGIGGRMGHVLCDMIAQRETAWKSWTAKAM